MRATANRCSATLASCSMTPRSACVFAWIRGRWTLTATIVPSCSVARWTWAVDAAANGSCSKVAYSTSGSEPSSFVTMACDVVPGERSGFALELGELVDPGRAAGRRSGWPSSGRSSRRSGPSCWSIAPDPFRSGGAAERVLLAQDHAREPAPDRTERRIRAGAMSRRSSRSCCRPAAGAGSRGSRCAGASAATPGSVHIAAIALRVQVRSVEAQGRVGKRWRGACTAPAATMTQRMVGWATVAILIGAMIEVIQMAMALMITTNKPIVENRSRPVRATRTGRANRLTRTRTAAQVRKPMSAGPAEGGDRRATPSRTGTAGGP